MGNHNMKGYPTYEGYMGYIEGEYMLFATEDEYTDYYFTHCKTD